MAFALKKSADGAAPKKSPLAGWLGRKSQDEPEDILPEINVQAGLSRALRNIGPKQTAPKKRDDVSETIRTTLGSIEAALYAIDGIREVLEDACEVALSAKEVEDPGGRALLAERYDEVRMSVNQVIEKADPRAQTLIAKNSRHIDLKLGQKAMYSVSAISLAVSDNGLKLSPPRDAFEADEEVDKIVAELDQALSRADRAAASYCRDAKFLIERLSAS